nr:hypothetical protein [Tanacetum cinerariifolium]
MRAYLCFLNTRIRLKSTFTCAIWLSVLGLDRPIGKDGCASWVLRANAHGEVGVSFGTVLVLLVYGSSCGEGGLFWRENGLRVTAWDALAQGADGLGLMKNEDHQVLKNEYKLEEDASDCTRVDDDGVEFSPKGSDYFPTMGDETKKDKCSIFLLLLIICIFLMLMDRASYAHSSERLLLKDKAEFFKQPTMHVAGLMTLDLVCPSTYQLFWSSSGDSGPDVSFDMSASLEHFSSSTRARLATSTPRTITLDGAGGLISYLCMRCCFWMLHRRTITLDDAEPSISYLCQCSRLFDVLLYDGLTSICLGQRSGLTNTDATNSGPESSFDHPAIFKVPFRNQVCSRCLLPPGVICSVYLWDLEYIMLDGCDKGFFYTCHLILLIGLSRLFLIMHLAHFDWLEETIPHHQGVSHVVDDVTELTVIVSEHVSFGPGDVVVALSAREKGDGLVPSFTIKEGRGVWYAKEHLLLRAWGKLTVDVGLSIQRILSHATHLKPNGFPMGPLYNGFARHAIPRDCHEGDFLCQSGSFLFMRFCFSGISIKDGGSRKLMPSMAKISFGVFVSGVKVDWDKVPRMAPNIEVNIRGLLELGKRDLSVDEYLGQLGFSGAYSHES